ncbi:MAG: DNA mismatch repair protein MutT [Bacteroidaceae bacterium]|nr:DNA mismatch repair protein MutT [Bacteroidaceae bacterium]
MEKPKHTLTKTYLSVDCTLFAYDGTNLYTLLISRGGEGDSECDVCKLPGSLVYADETVGDASRRVLRELTGLQSVPLYPFSTFSGLDRASHGNDKVWTEQFYKLDSEVDRIVSVGYVSLLRMDRKMQKLKGEYKAHWVPLSECPDLAFDHNMQIEAALNFIRAYAALDESLLFDLLPRRFSLFQLRQLCQLLFNRKYDVRNFNKKMLQKSYIVDSGETEQGVAHRSARLYYFERKKYKR